MKYIKILSAICLSLVIVSCNKTSKQGKMIPKDAAIILHLDTKSLSSKLSWDEIKQTAWFKKINSDSSFPAWAKTFLDDPSKTGIDTKSELIFFYTKTGGNKFYLEGNLKDANAFESFNKYFDPTASATKEGDISIMKMKDKCVAGWFNDKFVYVCSGPDEMPNFGMRADTSHAPALAVPAGDLVAACKNIFTLKSDSSLADNDKFATLLQEGDIHLWTNYWQLYSNNSISSGPMGMLNFDKIFKDNYAATSFNFDNGKILIHQKTYANKELSEIFKKYSGGNINTDMVKSLPANTDLVFALHLPPQELVDILKLAGVDGFLNLMLSQQGLSLDQIAKATNGDMVFSVSGLNLSKDTAMMFTMNGNPVDSEKVFHGVTLFFAAEVGDKDVFNKIITAIKSLDKDLNKKISENYKMNDKYFVASNSEEAMNNFLSGKKNNPAYLDKIKDNSVGMFIDLQAIFKGVQPRMTRDSVGNVMYNLNIKTWDNIYVTGGDYKNGGTDSHTEINFIDKNTNSLKQLNSFVDQASQVAMEEKKKWDETRLKDTTHLTDSLKHKKIAPPVHPDLHKKKTHK